MSTPHNPDPKYTPGPRHDSPEHDRETQRARQAQADAQAAQAAARARETKPTPRPEPRPESKPQPKPDDSARLDTLLLGIRTGMSVTEVEQVRTNIKAELVALRGGRS